MKKLLIILMLLPVWAWADSTVFNNDTDIIDTWIRSNQADSNFGSVVSSYIYDGGSIYYRYLISFQNLNDSINTGNVIDSAKMYLFLAVAAGADKAVLWHGLYNNFWVEDDTGSYEGGATYNDWSSPDSEWTTAGANCAYDDAIYSSWDDAGCDTDSADRTSTWIDSVLVPSAAGIGDTVLVYVGSWIDSAYQNGVDPSFIASRPPNTSSAVYFNSREQGDGEGSLKPYIVVYHTKAPAPGGDLIKILK
jgi:hypothetical protein